MNLSVHQSWVAVRPSKKTEQVMWSQLSEMHTWRIAIWDYLQTPTEGNSDKHHNGNRDRIHAGAFATENQTTSASLDQQRNMGFHGQQILRGHAAARLPWPTKSTFPHGLHMLQLLVLTRLVCCITPDPSCTHCGQTQQLASTAPPPSAKREANQEAGTCSSNKTEKA